MAKIFFSFLKLNWDASCDAKSGKIEIGTIICNSERKVIGSMQASRNLITNHFIAEAYAMLVAVQFCQDSGLNHLILEGDALQVVNLLAQENTD